MGLKVYATNITASTPLLKKLAVAFFATVVCFATASAQTPATALNFDGVDDYVAIPSNTSLNIASQITIEAWVNYTKSSGVQNVVSKSSRTVNDSYIFPRTEDGWRNLQFRISLNGQGWQVLSVPFDNISEKKGEWHHMAATYDGYYMRIYIDGVLAGSKEIAGTISTNDNPLVLGSQYEYNNEYFQGKLDDVRIWNRALSACEIATTLNCELDAASQTGLAAYYKLNQGSINIPNILSPVLDASANANNGSLINFLLAGTISNWTTGTVSGTCPVFTPVTAVAGAVSTTVAVGSNISLTASGGDTYAWVGPNGYNSTQQNPVLTGVGQNASGTYTVTVTKNGCSASASVTVTVAQRGKSLNFGGNNDIIRIPNAAAFNSTTSLTMEMWIKPTNNMPLVQNIVTKSTFNQNNGYIFPRTDDGWQSFSFWLAVNGQWRVLSAPYTGFNQWTHVAATYDGFFMRLYMNGNLVGTLSAPGTITVNSNDISIGQEQGYVQRSYAGGLDELRFWSRALTQCEIQHNQTCELNGANNGLAGFNGLSAYYRFNQGLVDINNSGITVLADSSVNHNNGTLMNFNLADGTGSNWTSGGNVNNSTCSAYTPNDATATSNGPIVEVGSTVKLFASSGSAWSWTGPMGFTSNLQNPTIPNGTTDRTGNYTVTVTSNGCNAVASTKVTVAYKAGTLRFDGVNDQVRIPANNSLNITKAITLESWIYATDSIRPVQDVMSKSTKDTNTGYIFPRTDDGWKSYVFYLNLNGVWQKLSAPYPGMNQWHHLAATYDGYYMRIYLDGVLSASKLAEGTISVNKNDLMLGQQPGFFEFFRGNVEETRLWNRALNQCEIINNKNCELDPAQQNGLVAYYKYNQGFVNAENTGVDALLDASGKSNNGTLQNFSLDGIISNWSDFKINGTCSTYAAPPVTATSNGSIFGIGSTIKLFASGGFTYTWDGPNGFSSPTQDATINNAQVNQSGTYTVTAPFVNCVITASTRLTVSSLALIRASGPTTFCPSGSVTLTSPSAGIGYQWYRNGTAINGATGISYVATQSGEYSVSVSTATDILVPPAITVVVQDILAPQPTVANLPVLNLATPATVTQIPTALDNCAGTISATTTSPLTYLDKGNFTINWKYDDHNGNITYQDQQVVVVIGRDVIPPVLTVPANMTLPGDAGVCGAVANFAATATDNSDKPVVITYSKDPGTVFPVGTTTVTVTATDGGDNQVTGSFTVTVTPTVVAPITGTTTVCSGSRTLLATTSTGGNWSSANEAIATVDQNGQVTGVTAGSVVIKYTNACGASASVTVTVLATPAAPVITVSNNCGSSDLSVTPGGSLLWNTSSTASTIALVPAGNYSVTRTINGCVSEAGFAVASPKAIPAAPVVSVANDCGISTLTTQGTNLAWSTGATASSIAVNNAGTYSVTQTVDGCVSAAASAIASPKPIPSAPVVNVVNSCGSTALSTLATGSLAWSTGETSQFISVSNSGTYTVKQTVNGCTSADGAGIAAPKSFPAAPVVSVEDNCGESKLTAIGANLSWSNGATGSSIIVNTRGTYSVWQTVDGCPSVESKVVATPKAVPAAPVVTASSDCGSSTLTATGDNLVWNTGSTSSSIIVYNNSLYSVTQSVDGCVSPAAIIAGTPKAIPATPAVVVTDSCGKSTLSTTATGNLLWSTGETTQTIVVRDAGAYTVSQTVNGCRSADGSGTAAPKSFPAAPLVSVTDSCGSSKLTATGANLVWNNGATSSLITVTAANTYSVKQNVNGCTSVPASVVAAPKTIPAAPVVSASSDCDSSTLTATGSNLVWSTGATSSTITVHNNSLYSVTQSVDGCASPAATIAGTPKAIPAAPVVIVENNCGSSTLSTNAAGALLWSTGERTSPISVTDSRAYTVTQTVNGCTSQPGTGTAAPKVVPQVPIVSVDKICGSSTVSTNAVGSLLWSNNSTASSFVITTGGDYSVTVKAANGCTATSATTYAGVNAIPVVPAITGTKTIIKGLTSQLANTTPGGTWSINNTDVAGINAGTGLVTGISVGTAVVTYTVTSAANCVTSVTANITITPNCEPPVLTAQENVSANTNAANGAATVNYGVAVSAGSPAPEVSYLFTGATAGSGTGTGSGSVFNKGTTVVKITATNTCGTVCRIFNVVVTDATAPVITPVANLSACAGLAGYVIPVLNASDNCGIVTTSYVISGATTRTGSSNNASGAFGTGVSTIKWTVTDAAGNASNSTTVVTINPIPVATITAASPDNFCNKLSLNAASSVSNATFAWTIGTAAPVSGQQLNLGLDSKDGDYQLTATANGCISAPVSYNFQKQNFAGSYGILVYDEARFGKYNKVVSGSVGVMTAKGKVHLQKYSSVTGPGSFVKTPEIHLDKESVVGTLIYGIANVTLPAMQYNTAVTKYLPNYTASVNGATINGNYNNLTVKKNISVTVNGSTFGTIKLEEGASITFTQQVLDIENLNVENGAKNYAYSYLRFAPNSTVRVSTRVTLGREVILNPDSYKVTFYMGDLKCDNNERFTVKGADTRVTANIIMPDGKLKVDAPDGDNDRDSCDHKAHYAWNCTHKDHDHDDCDHKAHKKSDCHDDVYMTGMFIVEKLESKGNTVIWNTYDCATAAPVVVNSKSPQQSSITQESSKAVVETGVASAEDLKVTVLPNPSTTYFTLKFASRFETPITLRVMDAGGRVVDAKSKIGSNSTLQIGHNYSSGSYFAEITQGGVRKVIQLIKARG